MTIQREASGLLPPGEHEVTWAEARTLLVDSAPPEMRARRSATFAAVTGWAGAVAPIFGSGELLLGGDFMRFGAPTEVCTVAYLPDDEDVADGAEVSGITASFVNISDVAYSSPGYGGYLKERSAVGGCVDAFVTSRFTHRTYSRGLAAVIGPSGFAEPGVSQGVLKVVIGE